MRKSSLTEKLAFMRELGKTKNRNIIVCVSERKIKSYGGP